MALSHFLALFPRRDKYIEKLPGRDWQWRDRPLQDYQIAGVISDEGRGLFRGCAWAHKTRFAVLDVDQGSKYHNPKELQLLASKLSAGGLSLIPYQSSATGGWHLYLFFEDWQDSDEVKDLLKSWLKVNDYEIKGGTLEVFPSGNGLRLPLQAGFAWLDANGQLLTQREELTQNQAIALFLADLENSQVNWAVAKERIESQLCLIRSADAGAGSTLEDRVAVDGSEELFTRGLDWEKYHRGRDYWLSGLSGPGQRHDAVICIGHFLWYGDPSLGLRSLPYPSNASARAALILGWLKEKHNGHSDSVNLGRWCDIEGQIERACSWTAEGAQVKERDSYPLTERLIDRLQETKLTPEDFKKANRRKQGAARAKIKRALAQCVDEGRQVTRNTLALISGCSPNTVSKHADLWSLLAAGSHAYITGGLGGSPGSLQLVLSSGSEEISLIPSDLAVMELENFLPVLDGGLTEVLDCSSTGNAVSVRRTVTAVACELVGSGGSLELAGLDPLDSSVAPLLFCLAESLPSNSQNQDQALRVPAAVLTPGPWFEGIQAERQMCAGGIFLVSCLAESVGCRGP